MKVEAISASKVRFTLNAPKPGLIAQFATDFAQPFQPAHLLGKFHPSMNKDANQLAQSLGFKDGYEVINFYYGQSDWKDVPQPILKDAAKANKLVEAGFTAVAPTLESFIVVEDTLDGRRLVANPYFFMVDSQGNQLPYINEINEVYIGDEDVQTAKMVAGEVTYKLQSVNLPSAPVLLQNAEKGNYSVELRPTVGMAVFAFNLTAQDEAKRAVFNDLNFRRAMSHAINRDQINEIAYFGLGTPLQYTAFDADTASFVSDKHRNAYIKFDPVEAGKLLDAANIRDQDGDGDRDLPNGQELRLNIQFATQGVAVDVVEIIAQNWSDVGVTTTIKEVTSDEYRASQSANELDVHVWTKGEPLAFFLGNTELLVPPYDDYFDLRNAMLWDQYLNTNGKEGVKPPQTVYEMQKLAREFTTVEAGTDRSNELGRQIVQRVVDDLFFIGTVKAVSPIYFSNNLSNFKVFLTASFSYYRTFPYLPPQWSLN
jgi:peptide/nickel transport system substrate-binding protein